MQRSKVCIIPIIADTRARDCLKSNKESESGVSTRAARVYYSALGPYVRARPGRFSLAESLLAVLNHADVNLVNLG